jgi:proteasome lid subunit RPN8/RPN11
MNVNEIEAYTMPLLILSRVLREMHRAARAHNNDECMGLLTSLPGETAITGAYLLDAEVAPAHAEADPMALKHAADEIRASGQVARGLFHSHGRHPVFHSGTDHTTVHRILPAMAEANFERHGGRATPWIAEPGHAALPLADGRVLAYRLAARPGSFDYEPEWTSIRFARRDTTEPTAMHTAGRLELAAGGVALICGLPEGVTLTSTVSDDAPSRTARLYSVVVNCAGDYEAKCLVVAEIGGEAFVRLDPCEILDVDDDSAPRSGGRFLTARPRLLVA